MPVERFYTPIELSEYSSVVLEGPEFHHLAHVVRIKTDEEVELVNGRGALAVAIVQRLNKKQAELLVKKVEILPRPKMEIILAQAIPRLNRLDFILEKATELGMTQLWLFPGARSERKSLTESQLERIHTMTVAAMKQCGRLYLPTVVIKPELSKWKQFESPAFFGELNAEAPLLRDAWPKHKHDQSREVVIFIGPEGGFTDVEEGILKGLNVEGVRLHSNVLRTDTASLVALTLLTHDL